MQFLPDLIPEAEMLQDQLFVFPIFRPRTRTISVRDFIFKLRSSRKSKTALRSGFQNNVKQTFGQPLGVLDTLLIPGLIIGALIFMSIVDKCRLKSLAFRFLNSLNELFS